MSLWLVCTMLEGPWVARNIAAWEAVKHTIKGLKSTICLTTFHVIFNSLVELLHILAP